MDELKQDYEKLEKKCNEAKRIYKELKEQLLRHKGRIRNYFSIEVGGILDEDEHIVFDQLWKHVEKIEEVNGNLFSGSKNPMSYHGVRFTVDGKEYLYRSASSWCHSFDDFGPVLFDEEIMDEIDKDYEKLEEDVERASLRDQYPNIPSVDVMYGKSYQKVYEIINDIVKEYGVPAGVAFFYEWENY